MNAETIAEVIRRVQSADEESLHVAYRTLRNATEDDVARLASAGLFTHLAHILSPEHLPIARVIGAIIIDLTTRKNKAIKQAIRDAKVFPQLSRMAADSNTSVAKTALDTLWNQSARDEHVKDVLRHLGTISILLNHIAHSSMQVQLSACGVLSNLALDAACCREITAREGVDVVARLLEVRDVPELHVRALSAVWNLSANPLARSRVIELKLPERVLDFAASNDRFVEEKATGCLAELVLMSRAAQTSIRERGIRVLLSKLWPAQGAQALLEGGTRAVGANKTDKTRFSMVLALACLSLDASDLDPHIRTDVENCIRVFCTTHATDHEFGWSWLPEEIQALIPLLESPSTAHQLIGTWTLRYVLRSDRLESVRSSALMCGVLAPLSMLANSPDWHVRAHASGLLAILTSPPSKPPASTLNTVGPSEPVADDAESCSHLILDRLDADSRFQRVEGRMLIDSHPVHAAIAAARSPVLMKMLQSGMTESQGAEVHVIPEATPALPMIVQAMYTDSFIPRNAQGSRGEMALHAQTEELDLGPEILVLADYLMMPRAKAMAEEHLLPLVVPETVQMWFEVARVAGAKKLEERCRQIARDECPRSPSEDASSRMCGWDRELEAERRDLGIDPTVF